MRSWYGNLWCNNCHIQMQLPTGTQCAAVARHDFHGGSIGMEHMSFGDTGIHGSITQPPQTLFIWARRLSHRKTIQIPPLLSVSTKGESFLASWIFVGMQAEKHITCVRSERTQLVPRKTAILLLQALPIAIDLCLFRKLRQTCLRRTASVT